jgi:type 1 glutamine amidotransferase
MPLMSWRTLLLALTLAVCMNTPALAEPKKRLLLVGGGPDGHPPTTHEYMAGLRVLGRCLEPVAGLEVTTVRAEGTWKEGPELLERADGVVLFLGEGAQWVGANAERHRALERLAARGGGLVALHWAIGTREAGPIADFVQLLGGCHGGPDRKYQVLEATAEVAEADQPIPRGIHNFRVKDEFYYRLKFVQPAGSVTSVLRVPIEGTMETVAWAWERPDGGRSFGFSGLHFHSNWRLPEYRRLVAQGVLWTLKLPIPREGLGVDVKDEDLELKERRQP